MAIFNEDTRVKIPATVQFLRLGYKYQSLKEIDLDKETRVAINRFKPAIERINGRSFSDDEIRAILDDILAAFLFGFLLYYHNKYNYSQYFRFS